MQQVVRILRLKNFPVRQMLQLEEALLRTQDANWVVFNVGAAAPAVVLGLSGKPAELVDVQACKAAGVPMIRRFSGGGTVVVDKGTVFASLIFSASAAPAVPLYPRPLMAYSAKMFGHAFAACPDFALRENDFVLGERKVGGNAQCISKSRWLHHTSFLWDFDEARMQLLKQPPKAPDYRGGRQHDAFVARLRDRLRCKYDFVDSLIEGVERSGFVVEESTLGQAEACLLQEHHQSVKDVPYE